MEGVTRVRERVAMSMGISAIRNPGGAIRSLIEQLPSIQESATAQGFATWAQVPENLKSLHLACEGASAEWSRTENQSLENLSISDLLAEIASSQNSVQLSEGAASAEFVIEANVPMMESTLRYLLEWAAESADASSVAVDLVDGSDSLTIGVTVENGSWGEVSLMNIPSGLLGAYLTCFHHGGTLDISSKDGSGIGIKIGLLKEQSNVVEAIHEFDWIERVLTRFENW